MVHLTDGELLSAPHSVLFTSTDHALEYVMMKGRMMAINTSRILPAAAVLSAAALVLIACGGEEEASGDCDETYTIGFSHPLGEVDFVDTLKTQAQEYGGEAECVEVLLDSTIEANLESQRETIESWVNQGVDAIVLWPTDVGAFTGLQEQAQSAGISWLTYSSHMEGSDGSVGFDNEYSGQIIADDLEEWLDEHYPDGEGITAAVTEIAALPQLAGRWEVPLEMLEERGIEVVSFQDCGDTSCGLQVAEDALSENDDLRIFIGANDDAAVGALRAFDASDVEPDDAYLAGQDGIPEAFNAIEGGTAYKSSAAIDIEHLATSIVENSLAAITGEGDSNNESPFELVVAEDPETLERMRSMFE